MDRGLAPAYAPVEGHFCDGLGERRLVADPARGDTLELLHLNGELAAVPSFEFALRERVSRLSTFRHAYYGYVRGVERLTDQAATLTVVCDHTPGVRLSELLDRSEARHLAIDINAALCLIRQLVPAVAILHEHARDVAHGALGPERLVITPHARIAIVEYVMGAALEQLRFSHERYWKELRVPLPRSAGAPRFDHRADVMQVGLVALSLILGRRLKDDEYPARLGEVVASTWAVSAKGGFEPLPHGLRGWLGRALQLDARTAFPSAIEAQAELDKVFNDTGYVASPTSLEAFLARYHGTPVASAVAHVPAAPTTIPAPAPQNLPPVVLDEAAKNSASRKESTIHAAAPAPSLPEEITRPTPAAGRKGVRGQRWVVVAPLAAMLIALVSGGVFAARRYLVVKPVAVTTGSLAIATNPAGAQAFVDGELRGPTPLTLTLSAGSHMIALYGGGDPRSIPVTITAGGEVAQYVDLPAPTPVAMLPVDPAPETKAVPDAALPGWIAVSAPVDVQLYEHDRLFGSSAIDRIMLPGGRHEVDLVNDALGYRVTRIVQVSPGKVTSIKADLPNGSIALNALPWADVWIDGESVGQTPIGNLPIQIGSHAVVFRHPDLGEQQYSVVVTLKGPTRLSVDLRKK